MVLVAGTNGKTSTARMVDALLRELGLRVGRYTSPHLERVTERISLDGGPLADAAFVQAFTDLEPYLDLVDARHAHPLSYFETLTALAYSVFADAPVDVAVVEVGMGGTWDATNVVDPAVAVVTADRPGPPGVPGRHDRADRRGEGRHRQARGLRRARPAGRRRRTGPAASTRREVGATVAREGLEFGLLSRVLAVGGQLVDLRGLAGTYDSVLVPLLGPHQAHNASVALAAVEAFLGGGREQLDVDAVRAALRQRHLTGTARGRPPRSHRAAGRRAQPGRGGRARRSRWSRTSPSSGWSPSSACSPTRTRAACSRRWSRWSTRSS